MISGPELNDRKEIMLADQVQIPMVISAAAVLLTLLYASVLDIRDRRVPFRTWLPMLCTGLVCASYLFWEKTLDGSLVCGYLALVAVFLFDDYLNNRGRKDAAGLTWYYQENTIFPFIIIVLALPAISWLILNRSNIFPVIPWYGMYAAIILYVSFLFARSKREEDLPKRKKGKTGMNTGISEAICRWYFVLVIMIYAIISVLMFYGPWGLSAMDILFLTVFCGIFYIFGTMNLFGWADAWALIFISFCIPVFPVTPFFGESPIGVFSFSVLINALILNLVVPLAIFGINVMRGNRGPLIYRFFGFPVKGEEIRKSWGFVMEDFTEKDGRISRRFIGFWDAIRRMYSGTGRIYTKALRENPEKYARELSIYKRAGTVWISYAVPFIIPITAGLVTAMVFGDILYVIMSMVSGA